MEERELPRTLADYPYVTVRIACVDCKRRGRYRLARLAERYGAETHLELVLYQITRGCPWQVPPLTRRRKYARYCRAYYRDLVRPPEPPHEPPDDDPPVAAGRPKLRVVGGGE